MKATALLAVIVLVFVGYNSAYIVSERDQVVVTQLGQYLRTDREPGLYFKIPFAQQAVFFEKRILVGDTSPGEFLTLDKKRVVIDTVTRWRIADPFTFFITVGSETGARARLDDLIFSELRHDVASRDFGVFISIEREPTMEAVTQRVAERAQSFGIEVLDVRIKRADLPEEVQASVFSRMVAERERIAKRYRSEGEEEARKIRAEADKQRTILLAQAYQEAQQLRGEGEAEATSVYAAAFGQDPEFYAFVRSLEAYERMLAGQGSMVLSTGSDLFRYLSGHNGGLPEPPAPAAPPAPQTPQAPGPAVSTSPN